MVSQPRFPSAAPQTLLPAESYRAFFNTVPSGLFVLDPDGGIVAVNEPAAAILGYRPEELCGLQVDHLLPRRYRDKYCPRLLLRELVRQPEARAAKVFYGRHRDGREIPMGASLRVCSTETDPLIVGVTADIGRRRGMLQEYRQLYSRFRYLLSASSTVIYTVELESHRQSYISDNVSRLLGYTSAEVLAQENFWYRHLHPDDRRKTVAEYRRQLHRGEGTLEYRIRHADGGYRWIYDNFRVIRHQAGKPAELLGSWTDISARKAAEAERDRMETELRLAQKLEAVGQLASGIAHEINTPVQFVGDNAYFLQTAFEDLQTLLGRYREILTRLPGHRAALAELQQAEEEADLEYLEAEVPLAFERISDGIGRVTAIVRAMKEFGHAGQGEKAPADINKALQNTLTVARNEYKYVADVETELGDIPPVECLIGDVNQVFLNLIVNAAHAIADVVKDSGGRGKITLRTRHEDGEVVIEIADTGTGIPKQIADRIFDPFFTTKEVGKGTGQGLAIARNIVVDKHGGSLTFESRPGEGTSFFIRLPIQAREGQG